MALDELSHLLGSIEGELKGINKRLDIQGKAIGDISTKVHDIDKRTVRNGTIAGGVASVGIAVIIESAKAALKTHGA